MSGSLVIIGGNNKASHVEVLSEVVRRMNGGKLAIIVTATGSDPDKHFASLKKSFGDAGQPADRCVLIPVYAEGVTDEQGRNLENGDAEGLTDLLEGVTGVWFNGGSQVNTVKAFLREDGSDTAFLAAVRSIYENGGVLAGSSAGAAIMSRGMIWFGNTKGVLCKEIGFGRKAYENMNNGGMTGLQLILGQGLGFFPEGIVDQHFNKRPRLIRSVESALNDPFGSKVAYSISEDTAMVYRDGRFFVLGSAVVYVFDCRKAVSEGTGNYEGIVVHALQRGDSFDCTAMKASIAPHEEEAKREFAKEVFSGGTPDGAVFDTMMAGLLNGEDGSLYDCEVRGNKYVRAAAVYDCGTQDILLDMRYYRTADTCGRTAEHTSFTNVLFSCRKRLLE